MAVNLAMQIGDQCWLLLTGFMDMRTLPCFGVMVAASALWLALPQTASAEDTQSPKAWQACVGTTSTPDDRIAGCSSVIDARAETGGRLAGAYCIRGEAFTEKRDFDRALADLDEAMRIDPDYACAWTNRGRVYALKGDPDRAIADYDQAIRIDPGFALAFNNRGDAWFGKGDIEHALADFNAAIRYNPELAIGYGNRGYLYYRKHDMTRALAE